MMKHNRQALKLDFFQSDIDDVKSFLSQNGIKLNGGGIAKKTKGRRKEKQEYKDTILEKALEKKAREEAKNLEIPVDQLKKAKKTVIGLLMKKLQQVIDNQENINPQELEKILKMIKTELGEPTNISKTDATIKSEPLDESLFIQN